MLLSQTDKSKNLAKKSFIHIHAYFRGEYLRFRCARLFNTDWISVYTINAQIELSVNLACGIF